MHFQIKPLQADAFSHLFELSDTALKQMDAVREIVTAHPGTPCRVSLDDAQIGETVILCNHMHQPANSPYQSSHAIFVRENAPQAAPAMNEVPDVIRSRLISLRFFDSNHMIILADVMDGNDVAQAISNAFEEPAIAYAHIHFAKPGCFAAAAYPVR